MSDEEDDSGEILKEFMSTQNKDKFLPAKRTRKIKIENSVLKKPNENKKKDKSLTIRILNFHYII